MLLEEVEVALLYPQKLDTALTPRGLTGLWRLGWLSFFFLGCTPTRPQIPLGIQPDYHAYIPARTAVLGCQGWPLTARFTGQSITNVDDQTIQALCAAFDRQVIEGFSEQPFMNGYTPKLVQQLLAAQKQEHLLAEFVQHWRLDRQECGGCASPAAAYQYGISHQLLWRKWLHSLSSHTRFTDALLLPLVVAANETTHDDRGVLLAKRRVHVALLLIDSNNAALQWLGERQAVMATQALKENHNQPYPSYPPWEHLYKRVFTEDLWRGFPGRQQQ